MSPTRFSQRYFDKWYRDPHHRVETRDALARQVAFVVSAAEYLLSRRVRSVLDVGCGEGNWAPVLKRLRPTARYCGVDPSEYAVRRFGKRRNITLGRVESLDTLDLPSEFDLVVCAGTLNYLDPRGFARGLAQLAERCQGMAYLEIYTREDRDLIFGDVAGAVLRDPRWYRSRLRQAGFVACGLHCYVTERWRDNVVALERAW